MDKFNRRIFFLKAEERISELKNSEKKLLEQSMGGQNIENTEERDVVRRSNMCFNSEKV